MAQARTYIQSIDSIDLIYFDYDFAPQAQLKKELTQSEQQASEFDPKLERSGRNGLQLQMGTPK